jgi:hypothetical protein
MGIMSRSRTKEEYYSDLKREELYRMKLLAEVVQSNVQEYKRYAEEIRYPLYNDSVDTVLERLESDIDALNPRQIVPATFATSTFVEAYQRPDRSWVVQEEDGIQRSLSNEDFWKKYRRISI